MTALEAAPHRVLAAETARAPSGQPAARKRLLPMVAGTLALALLLLPVWAAFLAPAAPMDEGMLLVYPEQILHGKLPYRDFESFYTPGNPAFLAAVYSVFGVGVTVERCAGLLYHAVLLGGIFWLGRRWHLALGIGAALLAGVVLLPTHLTAYAWFGSVACALWSLLLLAGPPWRGRAAVAGGLAATAILFRQDVALGVLASGLAPFLLLPRRARWQYLAGFAAGLLPLAALTMAAGPRLVFENLFLYPVVIGNPGRRLPLGMANEELIALLCLHGAAALIAIGAGAVAVRREPRSPAARLLLGAALLAAGLTHQALQRSDITHVVASVFLSIALLPIALFQLLPRRMPGPLHARAIWAPVAVAGIMALGAPMMLWHYVIETIGPYFDATQAPILVTARGRHFPVRTERDGAQKVVSFLVEHARPGERLFVGGGDLRFANYNDTYLYYLLPWLQPATYFLEMNPLSANRPGSRLAGDVASADWLVRNSVWNTLHEPNRSSVPGPNAPNEVVAQQFELCGRTGTFEVYRRKRNFPRSPVAER